MMKTLRLVALLACALAAPIAGAQAPADKPVRLIVPFAAGTTPDAVARAIAPSFGTFLGQKVVVENRPETRDGGVFDQIAKAAPDGTTLLLATPAFVALNAIAKNLPYDGFKAFAPVARIATEPFVLVATPTMTMSSLQDLIALARANPGQINYASAGLGSASHLAAEFLKSATTVQLAHSPMPNSDAALAEVVAGRAKVMFAGLGPAQAALHAAKVKPLAVAGATRLAVLPDVPTLRETGVVDYDFSGWFGVVAPAATPKSIVDRLNSDLRKVVQTREVRDKLMALLGAEPRVTTPEDFAAQFKREAATYEKLAREMNLKLE